METDVLKIGTDFTKPYDLQTNCAAEEQDAPHSMAELFGVNKADLSIDWLLGVITSNLIKPVPANIDEDAIITEMLMRKHG
jgi:hypothetical protein